jgi:hypothetical protein
MAKFYMLPNKKKKDGDTMDLRTIIEFAKYIEEREKSAKEGAKPKDDDKKKGGDYWKTFFILMIATPPVAITYFLALLYGVVMIGKVAKGI